MNPAIFFVLKGLQNGEEGIYAIPCGDDSPLSDGWYFLLDGEDDPSSGPYSSRDEAERVLAFKTGRDEIA